MVSNAKLCWSSQLYPNLGCVWYEVKNLKGGHSGWGDLKVKCYGFKKCPRGEVLRMFGMGWKKLGVKAGPNINKTIYKK